LRSAKDIVVKPISSKDAGRIVRSIHYSGKTTQNSQLHFGVFLDGKCEGALQFGPSIDKRRMLGLVANTGWNEFIELNRMAFSEALPRNSESRAISVCLKLIKKHYPNIKWVVSFADGTQCGDGTIYRASGFCLTSVKKNSTMLLMPDGSITADKSLNNSASTKKAGWWKKNGAVSLVGFQLRYIYFIDKESKNNLTVPILPFSKIEEMGAGMYKGKARVKQAMTSNHEEQRQCDTDLPAPKEN